MNVKNFEIKGIEFKAGKINSFRQFHVVRRLGPILKDLLKVAQKNSKKSESQLTDDEKLESIYPIMDGISKLSDADSEKVLLSLLSGVEMKQQTGNWARLVVDDRLMFDNLELPILLRAAGESFMFNLSGFFDALPQNT